MKPTVSPDFVRVFGTWRTPTTYRQADALCAEISARLECEAAAPPSDDRDDSVSLQHAFLLVAREHRAQFIGRSHAAAR